MSADALARYAALFERIAPQDLERLDEYFAPEARFADPFTDVRGLAQIRRVFERMFETCRDVRFVVSNRFVSNGTGCLVWTMTFRPAGRLLGTRSVRIEGASHLRFDETGLLLEHVDYWDAGVVYARLPLLGALVRFVRNRIA